MSAAQEKKNAANAGIHEKAPADLYLKISDSLFKYNKTPDSKK